MIAPAYCLECNAPLSDAESQGLCARCLFKLGLASQLAGSTSVPASPGNAGPPPLMPFVFGGYRVVRLLGKGGMGAVYEAEDLDTGRRVALKALGHSLDSPETRKRFLREGRLAASINHPNSVYVYGTEEIDGAPVITMELVPGGTLHDRIKTFGPMEVTEAVDAIVQIIAGLEAAHAVGILHRDVKPSNCFIDPSGVVKIGDFGLSISTVVRGDTLLTLAGSVLGTPEFSSPEQLRGEELNVRSDIYSVGMTLYFVLTGKTAFRAENLVQLLATVLDKQAPSPREFRPEIPEDLARVVMRCLAKQPGDRFASYDELRRALLPFNSTAPSPATLGLRFVAGCIDYVCINGTNMLVSMLLARDFVALADPTTFHTRQWTLIRTGLIGLELAYFAIPEGLWGATLGKALVGLRVARLDRSRPGIPKALCRAVFYLLPGLIYLLRSFIPGTEDSPTWASLLGMANLLFIALLFSTARRRNGFAGLHDLLTKTRVIQKSAYQARIAVAQPAEPIDLNEPLSTMGPYHVISTLSVGAADQLFLGFDTKLLRRVWIRKVPPNEPAVPATLRNATRPGRLRWLQGQRTETETWDAYESVPGTPLVTLLSTPQPWMTVQYWLLDLAEEITTASGDGSLPRALTLDRIWITTSSRLKLLDFPAPGADLAQPVAPFDAANGSEANIFLNQVAISALEGRPISFAEARDRHAAVPVPISARNLLRELRVLPDLTVLTAQLRSLIQMLPEISRRRRAGLIIGCLAPALVGGAMMLMTAKIFEGWKRQNPQVEQLLIALDLHKELARGNLKEIPAEVGLEAMEVYIAGRFGDLIRDPKVWNSQYAKAIIDAKLRASAETIVAAHPHPSSEETRHAIEVLPVVLDTQGNVQSKFGQGLADSMSKGSYYAVGSVLGLTAIFSLICALVFRGGMLLRLLGIAIVTRTGLDASRLRLLWRAILAWSPVLVGIILLLTLKSLPARLSWLIIPIPGIVLWSAFRRDRTLHDQLAGTWLVPR